VVVLDGTFSRNAESSGLTAENYNDGAITLTNVTASDNGDYGSSVYNDAEDYAVSVDPSVFNNNAGTGLEIYSAGAITLADITANDNGYGGAYLDNTGGTEGITISGTNVFNENGEDGLSVSSNGAVSLTNVTASANLGYGVSICNCSSGVTLSGSLVFNGNAYDGLYAVTAGGVDGSGASITALANGASGISVEAYDDIDLNNLSASNNVNSGVYLTNDNLGSGSISITGTNVFNSNGSWGLEAYSNGDISVYDVTAGADAYTGNFLAGVFLNNINTGGAGDIAIFGGTLGYNGSEGAYIESAGAISLYDVYADYNTGTGAYLQNNYNSGYGVTVDTGSFNSNQNFGLQVLSEGGISLTDVVASQNSLSGAYLDNSDGSGNVFVDPSVFNGNDAHGLEVLSAGDITLIDVTANGNGENGALLDNCNWAPAACTTIADVSIMNSNFDGNTSSGDEMGLEINSGGDVTLDSISASNNLYGDGADVYEFGSLIVRDSSFNDNYSTEDEWGWGLYVGGYGNVTLTNVIASENGSDIYAGGVYVETDGDISIDPSEFSNNFNGYGLELYAGGDILLDHVTADGNDFDGAYLEAAGDAIIVCSQFNDNGGYGVDGSGVTGTLTFEDVVLTGNAAGPFSGSPVVTSGPCAPPGGGGGGGGAGTPVTPPTPSLIPVTGGSATLDCSLFTGTSLMLANGDSLTFLCPIRGDASVESLDGETLPGDLPDGATFASALDGALHDGDSEPLPGKVIISFLIPEGLEDADLAILFWTGSEWVDLQGTSFDDGRTVFDGGHHTGDGHFEASTNFTGTFVLVAK
jgi:hypothetical protein